MQPQSDRVSQIPNLTVLVHFFQVLFLSSHIAAMNVFKLKQKQVYRLKLKTKQGKNESTLFEQFYFSFFATF